MPRSQKIALGVMFAFFLAAPLAVYPVFLMKAMCFALFACAFNLLIGFGGLLSFGHAMFLGTAGYVAAHAAKVWGFPPELAILSGTAAATVLGLVTGLLAIRRQGIQAVPRGTLFGVLDLSNVWAMYFTVFAIFMAGFLLIYRVIHSPFGQVL